MTWYDTWKSPVGKLSILSSEKGIQALLWEKEKAGRVPIRVPKLPKTNDHIEQAKMQLNEYFQGKRKQFDLPLDLQGTSFQIRVWETLCRIPYGETITYSEQASRLGDKKKARAVGTSNGKNPVSIIIPCHRVIGKDGSLTGFAGGLEVKQFLLKFERAVALKKA